tara:strand:+ start:918 stop:1130 length:213 start_codon:yes stop_codon:yes gene_type:complete
MTEATPTTIEEAIETTALGMTSSENENGRSMTSIPIRDLIEADRHLANKRAMAKNHFGMRMTKAIPPGGG